MPARPFPAGTSPLWVSPVVQRIDALIRPAIEALGFDDVRMRLQGGRSHQVLQIMAEPLGGEREMTVRTVL